MLQVRNRLFAVGALVALLALVVGGGARGLAQDATPEAGETATASAGHPAHIHSGTCETLGDVVFPLADVMSSMPAAGMDMDMATPMAGMDMASPMAGGMMGAASAIPAMMSVTTVDASIETILSAEHAINVHESADAIQNYVACGALGGTPDAGNNLVVGLAELNNSGVSGVAWLHGNDDDTTTVTIFLASGLSGMGGMTDGTDTATPAA